MVYHNKWYFLEYTLSVPFLLLCSYLLLHIYFVCTHYDFSPGFAQQSKNFWKVVTVNMLLETKSNWLVL